MFIGRERELAALNKLYESDKFEFVVNLRPPPCRKNGADQPVYRR